MYKHTVICGSGITGILTAQILHLLDPDMKISLFDAGPEPCFSSDSGKIGGHFGATLGAGRNVRQFTGTEGLSFQNPIHTRLLYVPASATSQGLCTIPEDMLTVREKEWRAECLTRFERDVDPADNPYDRMYISLNYGGMSGWNLLTDHLPELLEHRLSDQGVYVALDDAAKVKKTLEFEKAVNPFQDTNPVIQAPFDRVYEGSPRDVSGNIIRGLVRLPGEAWAIQSVWCTLYNNLLYQKNVSFTWHTPISQIADLPSADAYVWAAGSGHKTPDLYNDFGRVQGIGGWWLSIPNPGFTAPFKFVAPQPCGVINLTPKDGMLHVSGGFGWVGERPYEEAKQLLQPIKEHFIREASQLLNLSRSSLDASAIDCCIRPATPTGLPDIAVHNLDDKPHITISGAGKAGATQAPLLAMYTAKELGLQRQLDEMISHVSSPVKKKLIIRGIALLEHKLDPMKVA